jgi:hypothetical protein
MIPIKIHYNEICDLHFKSCTGPARALLFFSATLKDECCPSIKSDAQSATHAFAVSSDAWLVDLDAGTATSRNLFIQFQVLVRNK